MDILRLLHLAKSKGASNVAQQRGMISIAIRLLPSVIPTVDELNLPSV